MKPRFSEQRLKQFSCIREDSTPRKKIREFDLGIKLIKGVPTQFVYLLVEETGFGKTKKKITERIFKRSTLHMCVGGPKEGNRMSKIDAKILGYSFCELSLEYKTESGILVWKDKCI